MDVMIDIETLGTGKDAAIIQIGAVAFEPVSGGKIYNQEMKIFSVMVDPADALANGATVTIETLRFWLNQPEAARKLVFGPEKLTLDKNASDQVPQMVGNQPYGSTAQCLRWLTEWLGSCFDGMEWDRLGGVWANGPTFDISILEGHYARFNMEHPWHFSAPRDLRTILKLPKVGGWPNSMDTTGFIKHHAPDDCIMQIMALQQSLHKLAG